jgi:DNA-binding Lrp family transcriptional regulator
MGVFPSVHRVPYRLGAVGFQGRLDPLGLHGAGSRVSLDPETMRSKMSNCVFVQVRCRPGMTYRVAEEIALREIHSELYSTSGDFDLLMKLYIPQDQDIGKFINDELLGIDGIERTLTTMTFKVF